MSRLRPFSPASCVGVPDHNTARLLEVPKASVHGPANIKHGLGFGTSLLADVLPRRMR